MPCYIVTHRVAKEIAQDDMMECNKQLVARLPRDVKWQMSWYIPEQNHLICHFDASNPEAVLQALETSGVAALFPVLKMQQAIEINPGAFVPHRRKSHPQHRPGRAASQKRGGKTLQKA